MLSGHAGALRDAPPHSRAARAIARSKLRAEYHGGGGRSRLPLRDRLAEPPAATNGNRRGMRELPKSRRRRRRYADFSDTLLLCLARDSRAGGEKDGKARNALLRPSIEARTDALQSEMGQDPSDSASLS
jgi:hypothetical protein